MQNTRLEQWAVWSASRQRFLLLEQLWRIQEQLFLSVKMVSRICRIEASCSQLQLQYFCSMLLLNFKRKFVVLTVAVSQSYRSCAVKEKRLLIRECFRRKTRLVWQLMCVCVFVHAPYPGNTTYTQRCQDVVRPRAQIGLVIAIRPWFTYIF